MKKLILPLLLIGVMAAFAYAEPVMYLSVKIAGDGQAKTIAVGNLEPIHLELWAVLTDANGPDGDSQNDSVIQTVQRLMSDESDFNLFKGDISATVRAGTPAWALGSDGVARDYDVHGDMEWGGAYPTTSVTGYLANQDSVAHLPTTTMAVPELGTTLYPAVQLATFDWTPTLNAGPGGETVDLYAVPYVNSKSGDGVFRFTVDGEEVTQLTGLDSDYIQTGAHVIISQEEVPEPAVFVLLGMGGLALLAIRRRK
ncbi:MAG: PEP-CTERM sorting domain-containing protein [Pirellulales bacterium]|nr:PEP-CTERM sorting domain-containing protein [Pirellulales bacterium]